MPNLIDKIRFEVGPPVEINPKHETFSYMIELYFMEHYVGAVKLIGGKKYRPFDVEIVSTWKKDFANYLSLNYKDIRNLAKQFILNGGLGFEVRKVDALDWETI